MPWSLNKIDLSDIKFFIPSYYFFLLQFACNVERYTFHIKSYPTCILYMENIMEMHWQHRERDARCLQTAKLPLGNYPSSIRYVKVVASEARTEQKKVFNRALLLFLAQWELSQQLRTSQSTLWRILRKEQIYLFRYFLVQCMLNWSNVHEHFVIKILFTDESTILKETCTSTMSLGPRNPTSISLLKGIPSSSQLCSKHRVTERKRSLMAQNNCNYKQSHS